MAASDGCVIFCRRAKGHDKSVRLAGTKHFRLGSGGPMNPQRVLAYISAFVGVGVILIVWFTTKARPAEEQRSEQTQPAE